MFERISNFQLLCDHNISCYYKKYYYKKRLCDVNGLRWKWCHMHGIVLHSGGCMYRLLFEEESLAHMSSSPFHSLSLVGWGCQAGKAHSHGGLCHAPGPWFACPEGVGVRNRLQMIVLKVEVKQCGVCEGVPALDWKFDAVIYAGRQTAAAIGAVYRDTPRLWSASVCS